MLLNFVIAGRMKEVRVILRKRIKTRKAKISFDLPNKKTRL